ncbi:TetR family transcriptional regulator C-terminal domain-containing protein [Sporolactobacillus sp. Y61]|jgi:AcrR family transcriptional regulator|uniref:TetR family transcriptional regulator C-terminal domain-containing protein n=1 Tax=Sporolactobacillus sp. Y61 TaxID=3160863 RepID=A0AAU8IFM5_9BACL|nr:TetR family transcriptional regulator C-terminal domain-containing protein [Sporolactobacillus sp. THM19-2]RYL92649.1 TetR family transcriptional regulator [Sporolactobacillus sp. THM19-2]
MPKKVDHDQRKQKVAEACWRTIRNEGISGATVRKVSHEAGLSAGAMRHYFNSQEDLLLFSMKLVIDRIEGRFQKLTFSGTPVERSVQLLSQFLPLNKEQRLEMEVWYAFTAGVIHRPVFRSLCDEMDDKLRLACSIVIDRLSGSGLISRAINRRLETERLYALLDGLAVHGLLRPDRLTPETMVSLLRYHIAQLCGSAG